MKNAIQIASGKGQSARRIAGFQALKKRKISKAEAAKNPEITEVTALKAKVAQLASELFVTKRKNDELEE